MRKDLELKRFARDSVSNLVRVVGVSVITVATSILVARGVGVEGRGLYELAHLLPLIMAMLFNFGLQTATAYYVAHGDYDVPTIAATNLTLALLLSAAGLTVSALLLLFAADALFPGVPLALMWLGLLLLPLNYLGQGLLPIFQGRQDFRAFNLVQLVPGAVGLVLIVVFVWGLDGGVAGVLLAVAAGNLAGLLVSLALLRPHTGPLWRLFALRLHWPYARRALTYGLKIQLSIVALFFLLRVDVWLLNIVGNGAESVGIYSIAVSLAERVWALGGLASAVILPRIASWNSGGDDDTRRNQLTALTTRHTFWLGIDIALAILLVGEPFIVLLYGEDFRPAAWALALLLPGIVFYNMAGVTVLDIAGRGGAPGGPPPAGWAR
jgi:O-antigen/teichoic acid export membrane protein